MRILNQSHAHASTCAQQKSRHAEIPFEYSHTPAYFLSSLDVAKNKRYHCSIVSYPLCLKQSRKHNFPGLLFMHGTSSMLEDNSDTSVIPNNVTNQFLTRRQIICHLPLTSSLHFLNRAGVSRKESGLPSHFRISPSL